MNNRPRLFLDTSVLVSLALSERDRPPGRYFFEMAIYGLIDLVVSRDVTAELEGVLRDLVPDRAVRLVAVIAENLVLARIIDAAEPSESSVMECLKLTSYRPDAKILAAASETACGVLVTMDRQHLLGNASIRPPSINLVVMGVREALECCKDQVSVRSRFANQ